MSIKRPCCPKETNFLINALFRRNDKKADSEENFYRKRGQTDRLKSVRIRNAWRQHKYEVFKIVRFSCLKDKTAWSVNECSLKIALRSDLKSGIYLKLILIENTRNWD